MHLANGKYGAKLEVCGMHVLEEAFSEQKIWVNCLKPF